MVDDGFGCQHAGEQSLADALSREPIGRSGRVTDEERPVLVQRKRSDAGRDRPRLVGRLGDGVGAEH